MKKISTSARVGPVPVPKASFVTEPRGGKSAVSKQAKVTNRSMKSVPVTTAYPRHGATT